MPRTKTEAATYQAITVRFPQDVMEQIRSYAREEDRSVNEQVINFVKNYLRQKKESTHGVSRSSND
jgi:hypothetical protein